jgi:aerobic C4-dicarboxylate transport protein
MYQRFFSKLYVQVLVGVIAGGLLGHFYPKLADLKPLGDAFIRLIKMVFAPVIFAMVVLGIAKMESMKELGRVGVRALLYFEIMSTFALGLGLIVVNIFQPGAGMNVDASTLDTHSIASYTAAASNPAASSTSC